MLGGVKASGGGAHTFKLVADLLFDLGEQVAVAVIREGDRGVPGAVAAISEGFDDLRIDLWASYPVHLYGQEAS